MRALLPRLLDPLQSFSEQIDCTSEEDSEEVSIPHQVSSQNGRAMEGQPQFAHEFVPMQSKAMRNAMRLPQRATRRRARRLLEMRR